MSTIINGTSSAITFPDSSVQNTSAIVSGYVPYANLPAGSVLQVVQGSYSTQVANNTDTPADTGLTATITPKFSTSKILVIATQNGCLKTNNAIGNGVMLSIVRNSTTVLSNGAYAAGYTGSTLANNATITIQYLDSPATTSATTYKTQFRNNNNTTGVIVQLDSTTLSIITLLEIAG
jgi:hypothetical protein